MTASASPISTRALLLGLFVGLVAVGLAVFRVNWVEFLSAFQRADWGSVCLAGGFFILNFFVRALRWQALLRPVHRFTFWDCFHHYMIGYMANMLLPLKAGEIIRPWLLGTKTGQSRMSLLSTVMIERIMDIIFLAILLVLMVVVGVTQISIELKQGAILTGGSAVLLLAACLFLAKYPRIPHTILEKITFLPSSIRDRLVSVSDKMFNGAKSLLHPGIFINVVFTSALAWLTSCLCVWYILVAFQLSVPWYTPAFLVVIANLGMMLPSSPGAVGVAHFLYVFGLSLFEVEKSEALAFAVVAHGLGFLLVVSVGLISLGKEGVSFSSLRAVPVSLDGK